MQLLDECYFQDVEKIKTIGSSYMAASGLSPDREVCQSLLLIIHLFLSYCPSFYPQTLLYCPFTIELFLPFTSISALLLFFSFSFLHRLFLICPFSLPSLLFSSHSCPSSCHPGMRGQLAPPQRAGPLRSVHAGNADAHQRRHRKQLSAASW